MSDNTTTGEVKICRRCGGFGETGHGWVEGDCILSHRYDRNNHPPRARFGHVCQWCVERHDEWLAEILDLYATLGEVLEPGSIPDDTAAHKKPRKQPASPAPVRLEAWVLLMGRLNDWLTVDGDVNDMEPAGREGLPNIPDLLQNWAQAAFDALEWTHAAPNTVSACVAVLRSNREIMAPLPDVDEYDADLSWMRRSLRSAHQLTEGPTVRCVATECNGQVARDPMGGLPKCRKCSRRYGVSDLVRMHADQRKATA